MFRLFALVNKTKGNILVCLSVALILIGLQDRLLAVEVLSQNAFFPHFLLFLYFLFILLLLCSMSQDTVQH